MKQHGCSVLGQSDLKKDAKIHPFPLDMSRSIRKDANMHPFQPHLSFLWHIGKKGCIFAAILRNTL
ncbi:hypothetical protein J2736_001330 [Paenibacillus qinlingensis]|uniref:Uncharacterized protein n=1 Tax=Paenibacillus qinlingensis TaxID=1837343 RepID=A0ABU1NTG1_9BACL|nr:hypothetical protein [Paenibacillus qinlingensis]